MLFFGLGIVLISVKAFLKCPFSKVIFIALNSLRALFLVLSVVQSTHLCHINFRYRFIK